MKFGVVLLAIIRSTAKSSTIYPAVYLGCAVGSWSTAKMTLSW